MRILSCQTVRKLRLRGHENHLDLRLKSWTNTNLRTLCSVLGADTLFRAGHGRIHIDAVQHMRLGHQRSCWIGCSTRVVKSAGDSAEARSSLKSSKSGTCRSVHSVFPRDLCGEPVGSRGWNRLSSSAETSCDRVVDPSRCLADDLVQYGTRSMLSLQEDLWQAMRWQHLQAW